MGLLKSIGKFVGKALKVMTLGASSYLWKKFKEWMTPDMPEKEALKVQRQGSDYAIPVVYGERIVGAIIVDKNTQDIPNGPWNDLLHMFAVFCHGEIDSYVEFFFNGISWNDKRWRKDTENPNSAKWFTYEVRLGSTAQTAMNGTGKFNRFSATTSKYEGLACAIFTFQQNEDGNIWNGEPQITARIKGKRCYDPRTTFTLYTENPALHLLDYLKSPVYGKGLPDSLIDVTSFVNVANIADATQTATVDTQICQTVNGVYSCSGSPAETVTFKRFTHNNIIDTDAEIFDNVKEIANSFRGYFPETNGLIQIACEKEETPVFSFSEVNIIDEITSSVPGRNSRHNRVSVRFPNKANSFKMDEVCYPEAGSDLYNTWLTEDYNLPQEKVVTVETIVYKAEALQLARLMAVVSRNSEFVTFTADATAIECDVGDVVNVSNITRGWVNRTFRIAKMTFNDDDTIKIEAIQHDNAIYPWVSPVYTNIIGGSNLGDPASVPAPTGLSIAYDSTLATTGTLSWSANPNAFTSAFIVTVLNGSTEVFKAETISKAYVIPRLDVGNYSIQVKAKTTIGTFSPVATIAFTLAVPVAPTDIAFTSGNFDIEARPVLAGIGLGTTFEFATDAPWTIRGRGLSLVITSLTPATNYVIYARTVNAYGVSAWFSKTASTNYDQTKLDPFLTAITNELNRINTVELVAVNQDVAALEAKFPLAGADIGTGVVTTTHIANQAITNALIANLAINSAKIADNAVSTSKIVAGAVDAGKIAANAVGTTQLANLAITTAKIAANAVTTTEIANAAINTAKLANAAVNAAQLADGAVLAAKLADNAVTTTKIANAAIEAGKIAANAVGSTHLAELAVTTSKIAANAVDAGKIAANAVDRTKLNIQVGGGNLCLDSSFEALDGITWGNYNNNGSGSTWRYEAGRRNGRSRLTVAGPTLGSTLGVYNNYAVEGGWQTGVPYVVSFYAKKNAGSFMTNCRLEWNNGPQSTVELLNPVKSTEWQRYAFLVQWDVGSPVPNINLAGVVTGTVWINTRGIWATGDEFWIDDVQIEQADVLSAYAPNVSEILPATIGTTEIADNAITSPKIIAGAITAGKIAANTITANEIAANTITALQIAAGTISATQLAANAITSAKIAAGAITADKIAANSITSSQIAAYTITTYNLAGNSVTANNLTANSVISDKIAAGAITAGKIAAGVITANEIAAGTITASKLVVTSGGAAINDDPGCEDLTAWEFSNGNIQQASQTGGQAVGKFYFKSTNGTDNLIFSQRSYACDASKTYKLSAMFYAGPGNNRNMYLFVNFFDMYGNTLPATSWGGTMSGYVFSGMPLAGDWRRVGNQFGPSTVREIPVAAKTMRIGVWMQYSGDGSGNVEQACQDIRIEECASADLIVDGAITASKIQAGAVVAGKIAAGAVTAGTIAAGAVTADKITAYTLQAYHLATNSLTADQIAFRSIIGWNIAAETIAAVNIAADAITAAKIQAGAVTAGKIAAGSITSTEIAAGSITANNIQAGAITATKMTITGGGVINRDPMLQDPDAWQGYVSHLVIGDAPVGNRVLRSGNSPAFVSEKFYHAIDITKRYRVRFWVRSEWGTNGILYFSLRQFLDSSGTHGPYNGGRSPYKPSGIGPVQAWVEHSFEWSANDWQPGVKFVQMEWLLNYGGSAGYMEICYPRFEEMTSADLIVDGAIITSKIAANAVTANEIVAGAISTNKLQAGAVTANEIAANAITAAKISALTITGDKLAANTITGDKIVANAITANHIQAGVITADKLTANAVQVALVSAGGIDVTNSNYQLKFLTADRPIELRKDGQIVYSVNPDGTGFYKGGLGDNTVSTNAITTEARKAINPYYTGSAETVTGTSSFVSPGTAKTLTAMTTLQAGNKVSISYRIADAYTDYLNPIQFQDSEYTATIQRSVGGGAWTNVPNGSKAFTVTGYYNPGDPYPEPSIEEGGYYYDVTVSVTDTVPTTSASIQYRVLIALTQAGAGTSGGVTFQQLKAEKAGFINNTFSSNNNLLKWVDKESGFTVICGNSLVGTDGSLNVFYGHTLTTVVSAFAQRDFLNTNEWSSGAIFANTDYATIYNHTISGTVKWCVLGFTAI